MELTHFNERGEAHMVDVGQKESTYREAVATGFISMSEECYELARVGTNKKGDILGVARVAGIMAIKKTADLIPLCHNIPITKSDIQFEYDDDHHRIQVIATVGTCDKTGVEMEAMTGVQIALLTIYDMCKAVDKFMLIHDVCLLKKYGGKSGLIVNPYVKEI
ncbi:MAG: cyclic pyranopterin monophosphate synthase MoaC [Clostridium sp.]|nr:cyclic pyranopterin monophosphate synthase MoaC [Clostridium sp.]